jgi:hypothetical protein
MAVEITSLGLQPPYERHTTDTRVPQSPSWEHVFRAL